MNHFKLIIAFCVILFLSNSFGQSTSVFDATYFNADNTSPPLKIGKGFHINDVYKQTRSCFTPETCKQDNLTTQQTGGKKTSIKLYHTSTNEEFNSFVKRGVSGKVSFLNLFSFGGSKLEEYSNKTIQDEERIIFTANVDFGVFSFENEPKLHDEAKALVDQNKLQDFVKFFGTHYISGVRKESTINVILTKTHDSNQSGNNVSDALSVGGKTPTGWKGSIQTENSDNINRLLESSAFSAEVEINGPAIEQSSIKGQITKILNGSDNKKADAIASIIEGALKNISDPNQSIITQYYYTPFSLYGLDGIYWDEKKQSELTKLNEAIVSVYSSKSLLNEMTTESGKNQYIQVLKDNGADENYTTKFLNAFDKAQPNFVKLNTTADNYLKSLQDRYIKCSDIYCSNTSTCCNNDGYIAEIEKFDLTSKIDREEQKLIEAITSVAMEMNAPECQKKKMAVINIVNQSSNPYSLYQGDKFLRTIGGKETVSYTVPIGEYKFRAVQDSGFLMYATVNQRTANPQQICEEVTLNIGFED